MSFKIELGDGSFSDLVCYDNGREWKGRSVSSNRVEGGEDADGFKYLGGEFLWWMLLGGSQA